MYIYTHLIYFFEIETYANFKDDEIYQNPLYKIYNPFTIYHLYLSNTQYEFSFMEEYLKFLRKENKLACLKDIIDDRENTILHYAIYYHDLLMVQLLIEENYLNLIDFGPKIMVFATTFGNLEILRLLANTYEVTSKSCRTLVS